MDCVVNFCLVDANVAMVGEGNVANRETFLTEKKYYTKIHRRIPSFLVDSSYSFIFFFFVISKIFVQIHQNLLYFTFYFFFR